MKKKATIKNETVSFEEHTNYGDRTSQTPMAPKQAKTWLVVLVASILLMSTMGVRQTMGLFVHPLHNAAGVSIASISFALAIGQLLWGAVQPIFGIIADHKGPTWVLIVGTLLLSMGMALVPVFTSDWGLVLTLGILSSAGAGAGSFSVLIGAVSSKIASEKRSVAGGIINAGGSMGQFVYAPLVNYVISGFGWGAAYMTLAGMTLLSLPLIKFLRSGSASQETIKMVKADAFDEKVATSAVAVTSVKENVWVEASHIWQVLRNQIKVSLDNRSYVCLIAGFFTCGFHVAFLVTHLPGEVALTGHGSSVSSNSLALIGLFNILGSLAAGFLGNHFRMKYILTGMYGMRALLIIAFLLAPKTAMTFYLFAVGLGFTWLATVPPTAGLIGKIFGPTYLATLFGFAVLMHQIGGFLGAWLGGLAIQYMGDYQWMWYADMLLAAMAALVNLPIKEKSIR